jgi:hypothetical protein
VESMIAKMACASTGLFSDMTLEALRVHTQAWTASFDTVLHPRLPAMGHQEGVALVNYSSAALRLREMQRWAGSREYGGLVQTDAAGGLKGVAGRSVEGQEMPQVRWVAAELDANDAAPATKLLGRGVGAAALVGTGRD